MRSSVLSTIRQTITINNSYGIIGLLDVIRDILYTRVTMDMKHKQITLAGSSHKFCTFPIAVDWSTFAFPSMYWLPFSAIKIHRQLFRVALLLIKFRFVMIVRRLFTSTGVRLLVLDYDQLTATRITNIRSSCRMFTSNKQQLTSFWLISRFHCGRIN